MKKLIFSIIALVSLGVAAITGPEPQGFSIGSLPKPIPSPASRLIDPSGYAIFEQLFDHSLDDGGEADSTVTGQVWDIRAVKYDQHVRGDTAQYITVRDSTLGNLMYSCYDISDSGSYTDSLKVEFIVQGSDYAADNVSPNRAFGDAFYTIRTDTLAAAASANSTVRDTLIRNWSVALGTKSPQFVRVRANNLRTPANDESRCRVYWHRLPFRRS